MSRRWTRVHLFVLVCAAVFLRLKFLAPYPTGWDDVDFALALEQYDITRMQPHFPGYPIYILAAHVFYAVLHDPFLALSVLSATAGGLTVIPLWLLFHKMGSASTARLTVWLFALAPLPLIAGIQPMSDALGAFLAAWLAYFAWSSAERSGQSHWILTTAGITLGLLLGVRVSYLALSTLWLWAIIVSVRQQEAGSRSALRGAAISLGAVTATCVVWLMGLIVSTGGLGTLLSVAVSFTDGHFADWGGTYRAGNSLVERAKVFFFRQIGGAGLGTLWFENDFSGTGSRWWQGNGWRILTSGMAAIGAAGLVISGWKTLIVAPRNVSKLGRRYRKCAVFFLIWIVPYLLWAFFAQNIEKPRHILPLVPPVFYLLVSGVENLIGAADARFRLRGRILTVVGLIWIGATVGVSYPLGQEAHITESPMMRLARYVKTNVPPADSLLFAWEEQRVLGYVSPNHTVISLRKWNDFRTEVLQYQKPPARILATNALVEGMDRNVVPFFKKVEVFQGNPWIYPTYHTIVLYEGTPLLYDELRVDHP